MLEAMWSKGLGSSASDIQWGGILFPNATPFASAAVTVGALHS